MPSLAVSYKVIVFWFAIVYLILTGLLLIWPNIFRTANRLSKKWISTDVWEKKLNRTHDIDEELLNLRKIMGFMFVLLVVVFIFLLNR